MKIDRSAWASAYRFHAAAIEKRPQMESEAFWEWMAARMLEISNEHSNSPLIMGLMIAVFDDLEQIEKQNDETGTAAG